MGVLDLEGLCMVGLGYVGLFRDVCDSIALGGTMHGCSWLFEVIRGSVVFVWAVS